jgi:glucose dehydrogenase
MSWLRKTVPAGIALGAALGCLMGAQQIRVRERELKNVNAPVASSDRDWSAYDGSESGDHYSPLTQINRVNVRNLKTAWIYDTGERGGLQTNPLVVDRILFAYTPSQKIVALNAVTGKLIWIFDSGIRTQQPNRGMCYWTDGKDSRLLAAVADHLYALYPKTGKPIRSFGDNGAIDLRKDVGSADYTKLFVAMTSPGILYKDLIIIGFRAPEVEPAAHGDIRAYDVHTGLLRWTFHTIPHPGEPGYETWPPDAWKTTAGAANNWAGMALDLKRGIVYVPTGSAVSDFYGSDRVGNDLFADTLLALDAGTGKLLWHFQGVHHDIWDRDFPSPPVLLTVKRNGHPVDAVAQTTKQGYIFLFDRVTGKPLFPIAERPFPPSDVPGEVSSPTQPVPQAPVPYARQLLTADLLTQRTPEVHAWALEQFKTFRSAGQFVPFSVNKQTVVFPGFDGGGEWGGPAVDPEKGVVYVNSNDVAWTGGLTPNSQGQSAGENTYLNQCSACHGENRQGSPPAFPSLIGVDKTLGDSGITKVIREGTGRMPSFPNIKDVALKELIAYLSKPPNLSDARSALTIPESGNRNEKEGAALYDRNCAICHGDDLRGSRSNYPGLINVRNRLGDEQIAAVIHNGKGRMPAFPQIDTTGTAALLHFLGPSPPPPSDTASSTREAVPIGARPDGNANYRFTGYRKFLDPDGYPAILPPWGTLNAIDLNSGKYLWKIPLGQYPELVAQGMGNTGSENYGGPILTASGILFIGATVYDHKIRAFDSMTGKLLWEDDLPYAGVATPATYMVNGKQYVAIAASGQRNAKGPQGAAYIAFALP